VQRETLYRVLVAAVPLFLFGALAGLLASGKQAAYLAILWHLGADPYIKFPFLDLYVVLAAADCHRLGIDVWMSDPCDEFHRPLIYSALWLDLLPGFFRRENINQIGIVLDLMFIASMPLIMRPRSAGQCLLFIAASVSTTVVFALERANADIFIFLLMVCAGAFFAGSRSQRLAAYLMFLFGGLLKFYPLALLLLVARETWRRACVVAGLSAVAVLGLWWVHDREIMLALANQPHPSYYELSISAVNLPWGLVLLLPETTLVSDDLFALMIFLVASVCSGILGFTTFRLVRRHGHALDAGTRETAHLLIGAIMLTGCFFAVRNISYRGVFLVLLIPGLLGFRRDTDAPEMRRLLGVALAVVLGLLWERRLNLAVSHAFGASLSSGGTSLGWAACAVFWVSRELLWWGLIGFFVGLVTALLSRMPLVAELALLLRGQAPSQNAAR
jgi:hypothetical protein